MSVAAPPTAEGDLTGTPFAHLVVYALERKLTGTLFLEESEQQIHTLTFVRGSPAKCRPGDDFAPLGRLLIDEGLVDESVLEAALSADGLLHQGGLLGDMLVMAGHIEAEVLDTVLERQFRLRFIRMFALAGATKYRWYENHDELAEWGADPTRTDPFELLWAGLEQHGENASSFEPTITALRADQLLAIHAQAPLERLGLEGLGSEAVELLLLEPMSFAELCSLEVVPIELCQRVVYTMLLLRFFELGRGALPIGVVEKGPTTLARVQLKQSAQNRLVAAAEDESGDGERVARVRRTVDRRRDSFHDVDAEASGASAAPVQELVAQIGTPSRPKTLDPASTYKAPLRPVTGGRALAREEAPTPLPRVMFEARSKEAAEASVPPPAPVEDARAAARKPDAAKPAAAPAKPAVAPAKPAVAPAKPATANAKPAKAGLRPPRARPAVPAAAPSEAEPDSSVRAIRSIIEGKPLADILSLARARLEAKDGATALELAEAALEREPGLVEAKLLSIMARSLRPHADLKPLSVEIDEVCTANHEHADAHYHRGLLRKRLGDDAGAKRDFDKALELDEAHLGAAHELATTAARNSQAPPAAKGGVGLLGRLFRR